MLRGCGTSLVVQCLRLRASNAVDPVRSLVMRGCHAHPAGNADIPPWLLGVYAFLILLNPDRSPPQAPLPHTLFTLPGLKHPTGHPSTVMLSSTHGF